MIVLLGLGALLVAIVAAMAVRPSMVETGAPADAISGTGTPTAPPFDPGDPYVRGGSQSSGWSLFGLNFGGSTTLRIDLPITSTCFDTLTEGGPWPAADPACATDLPGEGTITRLEERDSIGPRVIVELDVSKQCYIAVAGGSRWPTALPECAPEEQPVD